MIGCEKGYFALTSFRDFFLKDDKIASPLVFDKYYFVNKSKKF